MEEAVDFSDSREVNKLIKHLKDIKTPPPLIVADALADILGHLNEDKAHDINQVYRNIWRVVHAHDASFGVLHHSGWDENRERGSTAIRAKSDILAQIVSFDPENGEVELKHHKLRGGAPLKQFFLSVKLVPVGGYPQPIPIVTGPKSTLEKIMSEPIDADERKARELVEIMVQHFPDGATWSQLRDKSGMTVSTYKRAFACARRETWLVDRKGRKGYNLNPDGCWKEKESESGSALGPKVHPYRGVDPIGPKQAGANGPDWTQVGPLDPNTGCKNVDATGSAGKPNEIKEIKSSMPKAESPDDELIKEGIGATMKAPKKPAKAS